MPKAKKSTVTKQIATIRYTFKGGGYTGVDAQAVGEELAALEIKPGDFHRTQDILDAARNPDSALHGCFTWDDSEAAEKCRANEARAVLRKIAYVVIKEEKREKHPVYYHVRDAEGPRYVRSDRVASDADIRASAIDEVLALLSGVRKRFEFLSELKSVFTAIDDFTTQMKSKK